MKRGLVLVEGQTERDVVRDLLEPHFASMDLFLDVTIVTGKRVVGGPPHKGGVNQYGKVKNDLVRLLHDTSLAVVTTLIDYYRLPTDFPGMESRPAAGPRERVEHVERAWREASGDPRFEPHIVLHELEAWVYAAPDRLAPWMFDDDAAVIEKIAGTAAGLPPEDIDEGETTSPAKRLQSAFSAYRKRTHGPIAIAAVGVDGIRRVCPHAADWLNRLEAIARS